MAREIIQNLEHGKRGERGGTLFPVAIPGWGGKVLKGKKAARLGVHIGWALLRYHGLLGRVQLDLGGVLKLIARGVADFFWLRHSRRRVEQERIGGLELGFQAPWRKKGESTV